MRELRLDLVPGKKGGLLGEPRSQEGVLLTLKKKKKSHNLEVESCV